MGREGGGGSSPAHSAAPAPRQPLLRAPEAPWLLALVLALAAALRFYRIGARSLWLDEAASYLFARDGLAAVVEWLRLDSGPPLYYFLLHVWMRLFGASEAALRGLSAVLGVALVALVYPVGKRLLGRRGALLAALLAALSPIQVRYAQEARGYTLLALAGLLGMWGLWRWLEGGGRGWLALHVGAFIAALYSHNYAFFLLGAAGLFALVEGVRARRPLRALVGFPLIAAGYLPWLPMLLAQLANKGPYAWMALSWQETGFGGALAASLEALSFGGGAPPYVGLEGLGQAGPLPVVLSAAAAAGGLAVAGVRWRRGRREAAACTWLSLYLLAPLLAAAGYSLLFDPIYLPGRVDQLVVPAFCLAVAAGVDALRPAALRVVGAAALGILALATVAAYHRPAAGPAGPGHERALARAIGERLEEGDTVVATSLTRAPLEYYLRQRPPSVPLLSFPAEIARHPGNEDLEAILADPRALAADAQRVVEAATARPGASGRLFVALVANRAGAVLLEALRTAPGLTQARGLGDYEQRLVGQSVRLFLIAFED